MNIRKHTPLIAVVVLIIIGIILRIYEFEGFARFLSDEGRDAIIVKNIVTFQHFPAIGAPSSVGQVYLGPFYYYLIAPFLPLFAFNPVGLAFASFFYSIIGIVGIYYVLKKQEGFLLGIMTLFLMVTSLTLIEFARFSWNPNLLPYFSFFTLYFFYQWLQNRSVKNAIAFGSFFGLTLQLHYLAMFIGVPMLILFMWDLFHSKEYKKYLSGLMPAIGGFIFFISPLMAFDIKHSFVNARQFIRLFSQGELVSESSYIARFGETIQGFIQYTFTVDVSLSMALALFLLIIGLGLWRVNVRKSRFLLMHIITLMAFILGFAALGNSRYAHYYGAIYISVFIVLSYIPISFENKIVRYGGIALLSVAVLWLNIPKYYFLTSQPGNQIEYARNVAMSFEDHISKEPIQMVTIPQYSSDTQVRYFLELDGHKLLPHDSVDQPEELFIICHEKCIPQDDPQWQIASFSNKMVETNWSYEDLTIYKIVHSPQDSL